MIMRRHFVLKIAIICIAPKIDSYGVTLEYFCLSISLSFYALSFYPRIDKISTFTIYILLL